MWTVYPTPYPERVSTTWISVLFDLPAEDHAAGAAYWSAVTGYQVSQPRGDEGEFATLLPPDGDDYLRLQRLGVGPARIHLDLSVADLDAATEHAVESGAEEIERSDDGYVALRSPGGLAFCVVSHTGAEVPAAGSWPGVRRSRIYGVCLDIPADRYDAEAAFWVEILAGEHRVFERRPEFAQVPLENSENSGGPGPLAVLLQRTDEPVGPVRVHLDLGTPDREAEVARHLALGGRVCQVEEFWTVLADPAGLAYCITDRDPATGLLVE